MRKDPYVIRLWHAWKGGSRQKDGAGKAKCYEGGAASSDRPAVMPVPFDSRVPYGQRHLLDHSRQGLVGAGRMSLNE